MAPNRDTTFLQSFTKNSNNNNNFNQKPPKLSMESLQRTISDISFELLSQETLNISEKNSHHPLPHISEVENAKCECCGMSEECTPQYVEKVRKKNCGKMICGLCSEAVKEEVQKNGGNREEALRAHVSACAKFNRLGRAYPVLCQVEVMREILRKNRAMSLSPTDNGGINQKVGGIARSSSCIPAVTRE